MFKQLRLFFLSKNTCIFSRLLLEYSSQLEMANMVKWLTRRIVAPVCVGSIPTSRPIKIFGEAEIRFTFSFENP